MKRDNTIYMVVDDVVKERMEKAAAMVAQRTEGKDLMVLSKAFALFVSHQAKAVGPPQIATNILQEIRTQKIKRDREKNGS